MRVVVGISGGVDSSVAAFLLKQKEYEVVGVTFVFTEGFDTKDASDVCNKLNIEHHIYDYKDIFKREVIDKFIKDYKCGLTPNPCVLCNRFVKFNFLYEKMIELNCDFIATGHYAKIIDGRLYKSIDENKDQTYFLSNITREQLSKLILPLEGIDKDEVRCIARKNNLITADKKDSTDVCFINTSFKEYMNKNIENKKGNVIDVKTGKIIGEHIGLNNYTIGQRRGLNIGGFKERMYVVGKNVENNILYIATGDDNDYLLSTSCILENVNFFKDEIPQVCKAKFRYRQQEVDVKINILENNDVEVIYDSVKSVTPGQVCVFYMHNECLGGGVIKEVRKNNEKLWYL